MKLIQPRLPLLFQGLLGFAQIGHRMLFWQLQEKLILNTLMNLLIKCPVDHHALAEEANRAKIALVSVSDFEKYIIILY